MVSARASKEPNATPSDSLSQSFVSSFSPAAESGSQAIVLTRDLRWVVSAALFYFVVVIITVFTLNAYFSQTWDATTFVGAGKTVFSPEWNALYAQSRADNYWPYAYPPLHAFVVAPFVALAGTLPDFLMVRVPPLLFDIALGVLLYVIVARKTANKNYARLAMFVWLLNPVTWYDTAVQGHFEAEWLFFVVVGYFLLESRRGWILPTLALAVAFLFKQNAILFALPFWAQLLFGGEPKSPAQRIFSLFASLALFAVPIALVSLPFLLSSNDYWYMNVQYVADVPLQTQSWLVALAGLFGNENLFLRASSVLTLVAAALISVLGARRKMSLWLIGTLLVLAFFLLSKKVVGYYYVMILPFAIVTLVPTKHFRLLSLTVVAISFISLSPYFASWANQDHVWWYSALGILNSALWLGIIVWLWREHPLAISFAQNARTTAFLSLALFFSAGAAALLQPFINSQASPIRAPLVANGMESQVILALLGFSFLVSFSIFAANFFTRNIARAIPLSVSTYALVVLLVPPYFLTFTLTKESTAAFESVIKNLGL